MLFCLRFLIEKTAKIAIFGLPNPSQNPSQNHLKSMSKKHVDFCDFLIDAHLSCKPSKPSKSCSRSNGSPIFKVFAKTVFNHFNDFWVQKNIQKTIEKPIKSMKQSSLKTRCFSTCIFLRFGLHFGRFWDPLGPLLGGFGPPKCCPRG